MSAENPSWGQERIANELMLKLGIQVSPRTVQKYLNTPVPNRQPDPKQRWLTFIRNHANAIVASDFFVVVTAQFRILVCIRVRRVGHSANSPLQRDGASDCGVDVAAIP